MTAKRARKSTATAEPEVEVLPPHSDDVDNIIAQWAAERPELDVRSMAIFGRIARLFYLQRRIQAQVFGPHELTTAAFDILANLRRSGPPHRKTPSALAASSMISTGGITFRMDSLEAQGLIARVRDETDRRVVYAELTDKGRDIVDRAIVDHLAAQESLLAGFSAEERVRLAEGLRQLEAAYAGLPDGVPRS